MRGRNPGFGPHLVTCRARVCVGPSAVPPSYSCPQPCPNAWGLTCWEYYDFKSKYQLYLLLCPNSCALSAHIGSVGCSWGRDLGRRPAQMYSGLDGRPGTLDRQAQHRKEVWVPCGHISWVL